MQRVADGKYYATDDQDTLWFWNKKEWIYVQPNVNAFESRVANGFAYFDTLTKQVVINRGYYQYRSAAEFAGCDTVKDIAASIFFKEIWVLDCDDKIWFSSTSVDVDDVVSYSTFEEITFQTAIVDTLPTVLSASIVDGLWCTDDAGNLWNYYEDVWTQRGIEDEETEYSYK